MSKTNTSKVKADKEKWNENVETCNGCSIQWKKIGKQCPVCFEPASNGRKAIENPKPDKKCTCPCHNDIVSSYPSCNPKPDTRQSWEEEFINKFCKTTSFHSCIHCVHDKEIISFIRSLLQKQERIFEDKKHNMMIENAQPKHLVEEYREQGRKEMLKAFEEMIDWYVINKHDCKKGGCKELDYIYEKLEKLK